MKIKRGLPVMRGSALALPAAYHDSFPKTALVSRRGRIQWNPVASKVPIHPVVGVTGADYAHK